MNGSPTSDPDQEWLDGLYARYGFLDSPEPIWMTTADFITTARVCDIGPPPPDIIFRVMREGFVNHSLVFGRRIILVDQHDTNDFYIRSAARGVWAA